MISLKKKVLLGVPAILIGIMLVATFVVSMITNRQSGQAAGQLIQNAFNIVCHILSEKQDKLLFDSRQMATLDDMGGKIKYVTDSGPYFKFNIMRPTYITIATSLYNIGASAQVWKAAIYDLNGNMTAFVIIGNNESTLGYIHNRDTIEIAFAKPGQQLTPDLWTTQQILPDVGIKQDKGVENKDTTHFEIIDDSLCLIAYVPIMGKDYNPQTEKMELKQVGTLAAIQKLGNEFVEKLSELTGTGINVFGANKLIAGSHKDYKTFDLEQFADAKEQALPPKQRVKFNDINLANDSYYQGVLPVYSDSKCVAVITSLYSKKIARANTAQIIKLLSIVYVVFIVLIVPVILLMVVRDVINPIQKTAFLMQEIAQKKDFNKILWSESNDEIGQLASAFNMMTSELKNSTTSIDNLNKENTDRKKAEEELLQLLSLHDATLEATADGILVVNLNGNVVAYNQKFLQLWRIPENLAAARDDGKLLAHVLDQLTSPDEYLAETKRLYAHPEESSFDLVEFNDGRVFERSSQPQRIGEKIIGRVWSFRDITDRRNAEQATADAYTQLKAVNKELISAQSQLIQSEKLSSIGQLAAGVAHEINNPVGFVFSNFETLENYGVVFLRLISAYDELAREIQQSAHADWAAKGEAIAKVRNDLKIDFIIDDIHSLFEDSREGLDRITKIIQSLRDFSRVDQVADICEYDLNDGIRDTLVIARNEIKYDCEIKTEFSEIPPVPCNPGQINQVILNILVNAAQAIKSQNRCESGNICIKTAKSDQYVICRIIDDGPGIPPEIITKVFDPFFTTKPVGKGTGLGLSISRDIIVNKHKGELLVDSTIGKGTTLTIKLPLQCEMSESKEYVGQDQLGG
jgi:signal transduction histidine kinase/HAMP domain-containing protein